MSPHISKKTLFHWHLILLRHREALSLAGSVSALSLVSFLIDHALRLLLILLLAALWLWNGEVCRAQQSCRKVSKGCFAKLLVCLSFSPRQPTLKSDEKPVASVRPVQSTPIPMMPRHVPLGGSVSSASSTNPAMNFPINYLQRAGVLVQKVVTTTGWELLSSLQGVLSLLKFLCSDSLPTELCRKSKKVKSLSCFWLFATPWIVACQAPSSMGLSRQEYWSGLPFPSLVDHPNPEMEPRSSTLQADSYYLSHQGSPLFIQEILIKQCLHSRQYYISTLSRSREGSSP